MRKMKNEKNGKISIQTQNPRRFPGFSVVVVTFFVKKSSTISMILFRNVSLSRGNSTTSFGESAFFKRKVTNVIGRETKHTFYRRKSTKKIAKVSPSNNKKTIQQQQQQQFHVLITLPCHLGQVQLFGTCWVDHSWRNQFGQGYGERVGISVAHGRCGLGCGRDRTAQRGWSLGIPLVLARMLTGEALLSGHVLERGVGHC